MDMVFWPLASKELSKDGASLGLQTALSILQRETGGQRADSLVAVREWAPRHVGEPEG